MTRRKFDPLQSVTGTPTFDQYRRGRASRKRPFRQLSLGGINIPPIPSWGNMYRTIKASTFADTEGISDTSWSTGVTGNYDNAPNTSFNCLYLHAVTPSLRNVSLVYHMQPILWEFDAPSALTGGSYDWWWKRSDTDGGSFVDPDASQVMCGHPIVPNTSPLKNAGPGSLGIINTCMVTNTHAAFTDDTIRLRSIDGGSSFTYGVIECRAKTNFPLRWYEGTLNAISSENRGSKFLVECDAIQHVVNGTGLGVITDPAWPPRDTDADWHISPISPGDTYALQIWYRLRYGAVSSALNVPGKMCSYIVTTKVSNSSRRTTITGPNLARPLQQAYVPMMTFSNVDYSPAFNNIEQTYSITISGHTGWTLKDGSNGPHKMITSGGWTAQILRDSITFTPPTSEQDNITRITLSWGHELASIEIQAGPVQLSAASQPTTSFWLWRYRPANSGDYATSTSSADVGTVTHSPAGVFTQDGTTTFDLCDSSMIVPQYRPTDNFSIDTDGRTFGLVPSYPGVPTSISITRTTQ